ncbi:hypothetical protein GFL82_15450 [Rhizobium laguerreae]|nr:hypothetical protein [Rhizobium laguerreae]
MQKRLDLAEEANKGLIDSTTSGIGKLVDADMETVSTRMTALQTQQQLGIQSLNISTGDAAAVPVKSYGSVAVAPVDISD